MDTSGQDTERAETNAAHAGYSESPKVSVIVPVYNAQPWIERCVCSLVEQTPSEMEFIFVDDCSTDKSMDIVEGYATRDNRIKTLYNEQNMGPGFSRNRAIELARGEYLSFIDSDDWISPCFFERLYGEASTAKADIAKGTIVTIDAETGELCADAANMSDYVKKGHAQGLSPRACFLVEHQSALFHRRLFDDPNVRYGLTRTGEERTFLLKVCTKANDMIIVDDAVYYHVAREGSLSRVYSVQRSNDDLDSLEERVDFLLSNGLTTDDCMGVVQNVRYYNDNLIEAMRVGACDESYVHAYSERLSQILHRLPGIDDMAPPTSDVGLFLEHGVILPNRLNHEMLLPILRAQKGAMSPKAVAALALFGAKKLGLKIRSHLSPDSVNN